MPAKPTPAQRIAWHRAHAAACGCRPVPSGLVAEMARQDAGAPLDQGRRASASTLANRPSR